MKHSWSSMNGEVEAWLRAGVIDAATAERIRQFYGYTPPGRSRLAVVFSVLGALLLAGGVILLVAHNWESFSRPLRVVCAFAPLLIAQVLAIRLLFRPSADRAYQAEAIGGGWALACGGAIAIVSQVYHLGGDLETFLKVWSLTVLPIVGLLHSVFAAIVYLGLACGWSAMEMEQGRGAWLWLALLPLAPMVRLWWRESASSPRAIWALWAVVLATGFACGSALERSIPGLWTLVFSGYFASLVALDGWRPAGLRSWMARPAGWVGAMGLFVLGLIFTYEWPWTEIGWHAYRIDRAHGYLAVDLTLVFALCVFPLYRAVQCFFSVDWIKSLYLLFPALAVIAYATNSMKAGALTGAILFNIWMLGTGITTAVAGARSGRLALLNGGLFAAAAVITARFFDADMSLFVRGIVFVLLGAALLGSNLYVMRRKGGAS